MHIHMGTHVYVCTQTYKHTHTHTHTHKIKYTLFYSYTKIKSSNMGLFGSFKHHVQMKGTTDTHCHISIIYIIMHTEKCSAKL
jgi:hypothetical protein